MREPYEWEICRLPGAHLIPLGRLATSLNQLNTAHDVVVYCRSGVRSRKAVDLLQRSGIEKVKNLNGGILAWSDQVDPNMPKY